MAREPDDPRWAEMDGLDQRALLTGLSKLAEDLARELLRVDEVRGREAIARIARRHRKTAGNACRAQKGVNIWLEAIREVERAIPMTEPDGRYKPPSSKDDVAKAKRQDTTLAMPMRPSSVKTLTLGVPRKK